MPNHFHAYREDVKLLPTKIPAPRRSIVTLGRIPFWWVGEFVVAEAGHDKPQWVSAVWDTTFRDRHEYGLERSDALRREFPALRGWGSSGVEFRSPAQSHEIGLALTEVAKDKNAPSADAVAIAARFMLLAGSTGCYTELSGT